MRLPRYARQFCLLRRRRLGGSVFFEFFNAFADFGDEGIYFGSFRGRDIL
jgi:hypothetical protein